MRLILPLALVLLGSVAMTACTPAESQTTSATTSVAEPLLVRDVAGVTLSMTLPEAKAAAEKAQYRYMESNQDSAGDKAELWVSSDETTALFLFGSGETLWKIGFKKRFPDGDGDQGAIVAAIEEKYGAGAVKSAEDGKASIVYGDPDSQEPFLQAAASKHGMQMELVNPSAKDSAEMSDRKAKMAAGGKLGF